MPPASPTPRSARDYRPASRPRPATRSSRRPRSSDGYRRFDGDAERQRDVRIETAVDHDLHRHALHYLDEIAGGILRRKGGELGARSELDAVDMATQVERWVGVDRDPHRLPLAHVGELAFLEIGGDPDFGCDNREDLL